MKTVLKRAVYNTALFLFIPFFFLSSAPLHAKPMAFTIEPVDIYRYALLHHQQIAQDLFAKDGEYLKTLCHLLDENCQQITSTLIKIIKTSSTAAQFASAVTDLQNNKILDTESFTKINWPQKNFIENNVDIIKFSKSSSWLRQLFYYKNNHTYSSMASNAEFFFDKNGAHDPTAELLTTVNLLNNTNTHDKFACIFPGRYSLLRKEGLIKPPKHEPQCPSLTEFHQQLGNEQLDIVFASYDLDFPASSFGHTFFVFHKKGQNALAEMAVSYAADMHADSISSLINGLNGNHSGVIAINPYYQKLNSYLHDENRSLYEIPLKLSSHEINHIINTIWELKQANFPYYFFDRNCAFLLLALLDAAKPDLTLSTQNKLHHIPLDSIKALSTAKLLQPSSIKRSGYKQILEKKLSELPNNTQKKIKKIANKYQKIDIQQYTPKESKLALSYLSQLITMDALPRKIAWEREHQLLNNINYHILNKNSWSEKVNHLVITDTHDSYLSRFAVGKYNQTLSTQFDFRFAFHHILDPVSEAFGNSSQIEVSQGRFITQGKHIYLDKFNLLKVDANKPVNAFFNPTSSSFALGLSHLYGKHAHDTMPYIQIGRGYTVDYKTLQMISTLNPTVSIEAYSQPKPVLALPWKTYLVKRFSRNQQAQFSYIKNFSVIGNKSITDAIKLEHRITLKNQQQIYASIEKQHGKHVSNQSIYLGLNYFFL